MPTPEKRKSRFVKNLSSDSADMLGKLLLDSTLGSRESIARAQGARKKLKEKVSIGQVLVRIGVLIEDELLDIICTALRIAPVHTLEVNGADDLIKKFGKKQMVKYMFFPISDDPQNVVVAMIDPSNYLSIEMIQALAKKPVKTKAIKESVLIETFNKCNLLNAEEHKSLLTLYGLGPLSGIGVEEDVRSKEAEQVDFNKLISMAYDEVETITEAEEEVYNSGDAAIIKLANGILTQAIRQGASDIHLEPFEESFQVRFRHDGTLTKVMMLPVSIKAALVSRLKIMSNLNIAEKRKPQDGRLKLKFGTRKPIDFRVSVLPTLFGEGVVIRILDQTKLQLNVDKLGFAKEVLADFREMCSLPQGMGLVVGPTGSGKTNTLYSAISSLNTVGVKILTVEDPVEFQLKGVNQVNVNPTVGLDFATALRTFLRQDPEIILIGEIRDLETAEIALKAAMTGHMVFSTLHTNDGPSTVTRLLNLGIPGYLVASALTWVLSQRLLKRICTNCKAEVESDMTSDELISQGLTVNEVDDFKMHAGKGCEVCRQTGYKGRVAVFELMKVSEEMKDAISSEKSEMQIRKIAIRDGLITLRRDALSKQKAGVTTMEEVLKKTVLVTDRQPLHLVDTYELIFEHGDFIAKEGAKDTHFYQLIQGHLMVKKGGNVIGEINKPKEFFCEMSPLFKDVKSVSIVSVGRSVVRFYPGYKLKEVIEHSLDFGMTMIDRLVDKVKVASTTNGGHN